MPRPIEIVADFFKARELNFVLDEENQRVCSNIEGHNGQWSFLVAILEQSEVCLVLSVLPVKCPEKRRKHCAELLARINYGLSLGCFEMDFETGEIHFKTSYPFSRDQLDTELLTAIIGFNLDFMDKFFPAIMAVIYGSASPKRVWTAAMRDQKAKENRKRVNSSRLPRRYLNN